jgi:hypothetical protein
MTPRQQRIGGFTDLARRIAPDNDRPDQHQLERAAAAAHD